VAQQKGPKHEGVGRPDATTSGVRPGKKRNVAGAVGERAADLGALIPAVAKSMEGTRELLFVLDAERRIVVVSDGMVARIGRSRAELLGHHCYEHVHGAESPPDDCPFGELLHGSAAARAEVHSDELDGDFMVTVTGLRDGDGRLVGAVHHVTDITERRRAEEVLADSERRYHSLFEDSPAATWEEDHSAVKAYLEELVATGIDDVATYLLEHPQECEHCLTLARALDVNRAAVALFEAESRGELLERAGELYPPGAVSGLRFFWAAMLAGERSASFEETSITLTGRRLQVLETCTVAPGHEATFDRVYIADVDVTERRRAERALGESERRFRSIVENVPVGMFQSTAEGKQIYVNPQYAALFGYDSPAECVETINRSSIAEATYETPSRRAEFVKQVRAAGGEWRLFENRYRRKDGSVFDGIVAFYESADTAGGERCLYGFIQDVSERKRAEEALRSSEERYRMLAETSPDFIFIIDRDDRVQYVNSRAAQAVGRPPDELIGARRVDLFGAETAERMWTNLKRVFETGEALEAESRLTYPDGPATIATWLVPIKDDEGRVTAVFGVARDITGRKAAEESLRLSEERYRLLFEHATEGIALHEIILDDAGTPTDYRFLAANPAFERHTELVVSDIIGRTAREVLPGIEDSGLIETYGAVALTGEPTHLAQYVEVLNRHFEIAAFRIAPGRFATVFADVTERRRAEELLYRYQLLAAEARDIILFVRAADGAIVEANSAAEAAYGYSREELLRLTIDALRPAEERAIIDRRMQKAGAGGILFETVHRRKDGSSLPVEVSSRGATLIGGEEVLLSVIRDVTERKQAEAALVASAVQLKLTLKAAVAALGATTEMRDPYTAGHQRRVAELADAVATELGWDEERIETVHTAALLHDAGKMVVPAEILVKPGRVSEIEMHLIQQHAAAGAEIVAEIDFDGNVAEMIRQHHERLDGSGYPAGLTGDQILPEARLLAVCDVVEAMISHRPHRAAHSVDTAMAELEDGAGRRYDAEVCAACIRLFREKGLTLSE
jgi:PAS domain S-box-containing protein/putative nucleotidyltransferase with HDIG domain